MAVLVDTNVIIDVVTDDPRWADWSIARLQEHAPARLVINPVVFAELAFGYPTVAAVEDLVRQMGLTVEEIPHLGLFRAAKAFAAYRSQGGRRGSVLPDFFVGGHAEAAGIPLLTRDVTRYRTYFPTVELIAPGA